MLEQTQLRPLLTLKALTISLLTACGGGSDNNANTNNGGTPPPAESNPQIITMDSNIRVGQAVDLFLLAPGSQISNISWQQTSGPALSFLAKQSKAIAFTPTQIGSYDFSVSFNDGNGQKTLSHTINVEVGITNINGRLGHAVVEGNKVSLRANLKDSNQQANIRWQQTNGPTVSFTDNDTNGDSAVFFNAPQVTQDTLLSFEVSLAGSDDKDIVSVLVENTPAIANNAFFDEPVARVLPYNANSRYANNLAACVYSNQFTSSCPLSRLPLIAQQTLSPNVDDIMERVLVSHQWMGDRFKEFLTNEDPNNDFKNLLRATTAIVISYDVRPSFYWAVTGAIYLDPNDLWLNVEERDTINEAPDFRASFGNDLQFVMPFRYVKNNDFASSFMPREFRANRQESDRLYSLASLMYHELAHANDFFPPSGWANLNLNDSVLTAARPNNTQSNLLENQYPLFSNEMKALAQVSFAGEAATSVQRSYQPADIVPFYSNDRANEYYAYSTIREDFAVLFEELMMQNRYQVLRDTAITNQPIGSNISARDYIISWGQRGRVGENSVMPRVRFVTERVLPELNVNSLINNLAVPQLLDVGDDWIDSLIIGPSPKQAAKAINNNDHKRPVTQLRYYHKPIPQTASTNT